MRPPHTSKSPLLPLCLCLLFHPSQLPTAEAAQSVPCWNSTKSWHQTCTWSHPPLKPLISSEHNSPSTLSASLWSPHFTPIIVFHGEFSHGIVQKLSFMFHWHTCSPISVCSALLTCEMCWINTRLMLQRGLFTGWLQSPQRCLKSMFTCSKCCSMWQSHLYMSI